MSGERAAGAVRIGEQDMWWCPDCGALRHKGFVYTGYGRRVHCHGDVVRVAVTVAPKGGPR